MKFLKVKNITVYTAAIIVLSAGFVQQTQGQTMLPSNLLKPRTSATSLKPESSVIPAREARLKIFSDQFVSEYYDRTDKNSFGFVGGDFNNAFGENGFNLKTHGAVSPGAPVLNFLNIEEGYFKNGGLAVGRKKSDWSGLDDRFNIGLFQPQFRWDPLDPSAQGLTGLFWQIENENQFGLVVFASPLYIPDQLPNFDIDENGKFISSNPFFRNPPDKVSFKGKAVPFSYQVIKPKVEEIVVNSSFAVRVYKGDLDKGFYFNTSYAYKPANQLMIGVHASELKISLASGDKAPVEVFPKAWYHNVFSTDLKYTAQNVESGIGAIYEAPENPQFDSKYSRFEYKPSLLISPFVGFKNKYFKTTLSYLKIQQDKPNTVTQDESNKDLYTSVLFPRYFFGDAFSLVLSSRIALQKSDSITLMTKVLRGAEADFTLWNFNLQYFFQRRFQVYGGFEFINVGDEVAANEIPLKTYRDNDMATMGVGYVF
jgi:hypothetical protein